MMTPEYDLPLHYSFVLPFGFPRARLNKLYHVIHAKDSAELESRFDKKA